MQEGTVVAGEFVVGSLLGRGGMGAVYAVHQRSTGRGRAMKVLHADLARDDATRQRFLAEARVPARVSSPYLCDVVAAGIDPSTGAPYLVMELLEGETLGARLRRGPLPVDQAQRFLGQIAAGLGAAHRAGLVHRDLKPENVFITRSGAEEVIKILDFGIAKTLRPDGSASTTMSVGSPAWMAPEQAQGGRIGPWTDVWAFGLVAFEVLAGVTYWLSPRTRSGSVTSLLLEILAREVIPASTRSPVPLPAGFDVWFARALSRDEGARFADLDSAWRELAPLLDPAKVTILSAPPAGAQPSAHSLYYGATLQRLPALPAAAAPKRGGLVIGVIAGLLGLVTVAGLAFAFALGGFGEPTRGSGSEDEESEDEGPRRAGRPSAGLTCKESDEVDAECVCRGSCVGTCQFGDCRYRAADGASLSLDCRAGFCELDCAPGSECRMSCPGGMCSMRCAADAACSLDCAGGACPTTCDPKAKRCSVSCAGGVCPTTQP